jgi:aspartyl-tRNA(Asn)/glutamyl-tRNA(Gln) amidotransferase subunit A
MGKRIAIQPNLSVRGWPTEAGSVALEGYVALEDATVVERLREGGASIVGSIRMSELGLGLVGDTGAQVLAQGLADLVLVTDSMGEARVAASSIGVFGFKPSHGIVSRFGLNGLIPSMEAIGILARSPEEIAAAMGVIAGLDPRDFSMSEDQIKDFSISPEIPRPTGPGPVGVIRECVKALNAHETRAFQEALSQVQALGLKTEEVSLADFDLFRAAHQVIGATEASSSGGKYDGVRYGHRSSSAKNWNEMYLQSRAESFGPLVKAYLFQGAYFQFEDYASFEKACRIRARLVKEAEALHRDLNLIAYPARRRGLNGGQSKTLGEIYDAFSLTLICNLTGQPSVVIPGLCLDGVDDLGLQLSGPRLSDRRLLSTAAWISHRARGA